MNSLSGSGHKGFVLITIMPILVILMLYLSVLSLDVYRQTVQQRLLQSIDRFSLVEMTVLNQTMAQFLTYDPQDFTIDLADYHVEITFDEETATILYDEHIDLCGTLTFDLVFGFAKSYRLERNGNSD